MYIQFSQNLIRYLAVYLGTSLGEIAKAPEFPFSRPYVYKLADGSAPISESVNKALNKYWEDRELTVEDLNNLYNLIDLIAVGTKKERQFRLKQYKSNEVKQYKNKEEEVNGTQQDQD